jgi:hypothetical protein
MKKVQLVRRGINARRPFRALNSVTELVGKEVEVTDGDELSTAEVEEVSVDKEGDVTLNLSTGDEVVVDATEATELIETGEVTMEEAAPAAEPEEFEVTREIIDADGNPQEVTTLVAAEDEAKAEETVKLLDSRRNRNSRSYKVVKRSINSDPAPAAEEELKEFKVVRVAECDGKRMRKIASVTAPTLEEAIEAVKTKDTEDGIQAEGYEELVKEEPKESKVTINSDVDEEIEPAADPEPPMEPVRSELNSKIIKDAESGKWFIEDDEEKKMYETEEEAMAAMTPPAPAEPVRSELNAKVLQCPETKKWYIEDDEEKKLYETEEEADEAVKAKEAAEAERQSNSFKGVSDFVHRKYGVNL